MSPGRRAVLAFACAALWASLFAPAMAADLPTVSEAWLRATPPGALTGAAYLRLRGAAVAARLVGARTERAARVEIHTTTMQDGMMAMRRLDGIDVPPKAELRLAPQGTHLMLLQLTRPLVAGERVPLVLEFADGRELPTVGIVRAATAEDDVHH